jgi:sugar O-acyltransferase (sialic acid O-acetyltransferase NeuD family)
LGHFARQQVEVLGVIIIGVRSPLVADLEETLLRLDMAVTAAVSVAGVPRLIDRSKLVDLADFVPEPGAPFIICAFSPKRRGELIELALSLGLRKAKAVIDPTAIIPRSLRVGACSYINAGVVIGALSMIGEGVFINRAASLGHHTILGDGVTIGPGATLAGNIHVGEGAMIGAGAVIHPDVRIGAGAVIAAGSVVRKSVPDGALVAGNPGVIKPFTPRASSINIEGGE